MALRAELGLHDEGLLLLQEAFPQLEALLWKQKGLWHGNRRPSLRQQRLQNLPLSIFYQKLLWSQTAWTVNLKQAVEPHLLAHVAHPGQLGHLWGSGNQCKPLLCAVCVLITLTSHDLQQTQQKPW